MFDYIKLKRNEKFVISAEDKNDSEESQLIKYS